MNAAIRSWSWGGRHYRVGLRRRPNYTPDGKLEFGDIDVVTDGEPILTFACTRSGYAGRDLRSVAGPCVAASLAPTWPAVDRPVLDASGGEPRLHVGQHAGTARGTDAGDRRGDVCKLILPHGVSALCPDGGAPFLRGFTRLTFRAFVGV